MTNAYAIYDRKAAQYSDPVFFLTDGVALRMFEEVAKDDRAPYSKHPEDYSVRHIGTYDQDTGIISPCEIRVIMEVAQVLARVRAETQQTIAEQEGAVEMEDPDEVRHRTEREDAVNA
jgi:hypothetical protein